MEDCIFCKIIAGEVLSELIDENDQVVVFMSLEGHPLIVTKKHLENIYEMDDETGSAVMKETIKISKAVKKGLGCDGVNLVQNNEPAAHQAVFHFHLHVKPRFKNDGISLVIPDLSHTAEKRQETAHKIKSALSNNVINS